MVEIERKGHPAQCCVPHCWRLVCAAPRLHSSSLWPLFHTASRLRSPSSTQPLVCAAPRLHSPSSTQPRLCSLSSTAPRLCGLSSTQPLVQTLLRRPWNLNIDLTKHLRDMTESDSLVFATRSTFYSPPFSTRQGASCGVDPRYMRFSAQFARG